MVITVLKQTFQRFSSNELVYRDYKNFEKLIYKRELQEKLNQQITNLSISSNFFRSTEYACDDDMSGRGGYNDVRDTKIEEFWQNDEKQ